MIKLSCVATSCERKFRVLHAGFSGEVPVIDTAGFMVTFSVTVGLIDGELRLPMKTPPAIGEEYEIVIRRKEDEK